MVPKKRKDEGGGENTFLKKLNRIRKQRKKFEDAQPFLETGIKMVGRRGESFPFCFL